MTAANQTVGYETLGQGPAPVIVMHDWMSTHTSYDALLPILDGDAFTYAFMDHRGYGLSRDMTGEHSAAEAAGDVIALADHLGWSSFHLIGHSMSGMIAQRATLDAPGRLRSMVAVTPVPASGVPLDADGEALFRGAASDDDSWKTVARMVTGDRLPARWYDGKLAHFRDQVDPEAFLRFLDMWTGGGFADGMKSPDVPALVIVGEHDFMAFSEDAMRQTLGTWYADCRIELLRGTGHYPMAETPAYFVTVVEGFLRAIEERARSKAA